MQRSTYDSNSCNAKVNLQLKNNMSDNKTFLEILTLIVDYFVYSLFNYEEVD